MLHVQSTVVKDNERDPLCRALALSVVLWDAIMVVCP